MIILTTGISGCGEKPYLKDFVEYAKKKGKKIKLYFIGEMMFDHAENTGIHITKKNVLNASHSLLTSLRGTVIEKVLANLEKDKKEYDAIIIGMHAIFFWKKIFLRAYDQYYLDKVAPDIFITFIDKPETIKRRLSEKEQWQQEMLDIKEILLWQNVEVEITSGFAEVEKKPFYVFPTGLPLDTFYKLLFHPRMEPIYVSFPMSYSTKNDREKIDNFVSKLNKYFTVFDPRATILTDTHFDGTDEEKALFFQTVNRDLHWFIKQSKKVIAYFPRITASPGVQNELREGYEKNKDVWLIFPSKQRSPFVQYYATEIFSDEDEFFAFVRKYIREKYGINMST